MSNNLGLSNKIDFIPGLKEKELNLVYKQASLFVLSSVIENCPSVLLEAMANQLPVLVTNVSPMPEFVKNAGKYFEIDDHLELSKKINKILSSSKLLQQMSLRSYKQAKLYSWDSFTKNVVNFCRTTSFTSKKIVKF
jgi:glycosyltransferase involved in cell wall biosynthesis